MSMQVQTGLPAAICSNSGSKLLQSLHENHNNPADTQLPQVHLQSGIACYCLAQYTECVLWVYICVWVLLVCLLQESSVCTKWQLLPQQQLQHDAAW